MQKQIKQNNNNTISRDTHNNYNGIFGEGLGLSGREGVAMQEEFCGTVNFIVVNNRKCSCIMGIIR